MLTQYGVEMEDPSMEPDGTSETHMRATLQAYIDGFNASDADSLVALFADDAQIEDPVGGASLVQGRAAIEAFYERAVGVVDRLELVAPIRGSHGRAAAMAFDIHTTREGQRTKIRAIDVMEFDERGKIVDMKAYHGPSDVMPDDRTGVVDLRTDRLG